MPDLTGQQLAERGGQRALEHAERVVDMEWGQRAYRAILYYMERQPRFTIEQVKAFAYSKGLPQPPAPGAWGPVTKRVVREGRIAFDGYVNSRNASQHGKPVKIWRVL